MAEFTLLSVLRLHGGWELFVEDTHCEAHDVGEASNIGDTKAKICDKEGIPLDLQ